MTALAQRLLRVGPSWQTLVSALLVVAAFPPWELHGLVWFALVPWLSSLARAGCWRGALLQGLWLGFVVGVGAAPWLATGLREFLGVSWPTAVAGLLLFAAVCAQPHFLFFAAWFHWGQRGEAKGGISTVLSLGLCYTALDAWVPRLFDVGLGYALHSAEHARQIADLGGVPLLTLLIVWVNLLVWQTVEVVRRGPGDALGGRGRLGLALALCTGVTLYGVVRNRQHEALLEDPDRVIRVAVVQGNVENTVRLAWARGDDGAAERQLSAYLRPTEELVRREPRPDLVVWPEATFPGVFRRPGSKAQSRRAAQFDRLVLRLHTPIVFGAYDMVGEADRRMIFNAVFAITPRSDRRGAQGLVQSYRKHDLLPFSETIPGVGNIGWIRRLFPSLGFFGRGEGPKNLRIVGAGGQTLRIAPIICSESLDPDNVIESARQGSDLILNVGSDGWFRSRGQAWFHLAISRFRSIETRLPQVRGANTGISALILPSGEIARRSAFDEEQILELEVPLRSRPPTLRMAWGDWVSWASLFGLAWETKRAAARWRRARRPGSPPEA